MSGGQAGQPVDHRRRPFLVGLHRQPQTVPAGQGTGRHRQDIQREFESVGLLGIDREGNAAITGQAAKRDQARCKLVQNTGPLGHLVARVECRQLDGDTGVARRIPILFGFANPFDGMTIVLQVAIGIRHGAGRLAQHVEGMRVAVRHIIGRVGQGLVDVATHDELPADNAHGVEKGLPDDGFTESADNARHHAPHVPRPLGIQADEASGEHQSPRRGR